MLYCVSDIHGRYDKYRALLDGIFRGTGFIDCGCGFGGRLGCLCLETMEETYV